MGYKTVARKAVIDLGSNTFHILIAESNDSIGFSVLFKRRDFVFLAEGGADHISKEASDRAIKSLLDFKTLTNSYLVEDVRIVGTACFRKAENSTELISRIKEETQWTVEVLSGRKEAEYIALGIQLAKIKEEYLLMMDIGGASTELICQVDQELEYLVSHDIGISTLRSIWNRSDGITDDEFKQAIEIIKMEMAESVVSLLAFDPGCLVGASGPFEILQSIMKGPGMVGEVSVLDKTPVLDVIEKIVYSSLKERRDIKDMPDDRADLSLESMMLLYYILDNLPTIESVVCVPFSLKEGLLIEMFRQV